MMNFYDRAEDIASLRDIRTRSKESAQVTVLTGRRRIGKTSLVRKAYEDEPLLYFFVARQSERDLCDDFCHEVEDKLGLPVLGRSEHFAQVFEFLMKYAATQPLTLFIDEFQDFYRVNKSVFSKMQRIWDRYSPQARIHLIVCGSIYSLMSTIFKDRKEPLYGRPSRLMHLRPFAPEVLKDVMEDHYPQYTAEDLLALFAFTGGVPKYVQLFMEADAVTPDRMIDLRVSPDSIFLAEGKAMLIEEFGKD